MRFSRRFLIVFTAIAVTCAPAIAALTPLDSALFPYQFEGGNTTGSPIATPVGSFVTGPTTDSNVMTYLSDPSNDGWFNAKPLFVANTSFATGWTIEARVKIDAAAEEGVIGSFIFKAGESGGAGSTAVAIGKNFTRTYLLGGLSTASNTDDFHVFRLTKEASTPNFYIYRDDVQLLSVATPDFGNDVDFYFGDGGGAVDGQPYIDYVRWTPGGYAPPVPEPASLALLCAGVATIFARRRRA